jgi:uncharacterized membrane protein YgcG
MRYITLALVLLTVTSASAQTAAGVSERDRWAPWLGCWQLSEESVQDVERLLANETVTPGARVCVTPSADGGATMTTLVKGQAVLVETIVADGKARPLSDPKCRGTQQAEWSARAPRIYARTEVACDRQPQRIVSGMSTIISGPRWIDIQLIESQGRQSIRVRRYRRATDQKGALPSAAAGVGTMPVAGRFSLADVKEAATKLSPQALHAVVFELGAGGYELNAKRLIELDEAGVPDGVIDLMVAMSFPDKFVVERATASTGGGGFIDPLWGPFAAWPYYAHPMYYSTYYSPFGYGYWGYLDPWYYATPGVVIINPPGGLAPGEPSGNGRVVDGQGYTRIRPNVPDPPARTGHGDNSGVTASSSGSSGSNSGSSTGGSVSTGGYSGGGGGGERVAVPRPPGGN